MKIRFLGTPLEHIDQLCDEEQIVKITVSTFKREMLTHYEDGKTSIEEIQTGGWGVQIKSSKDLIQFIEDDKDDEYDAKGKKEYSDKVKERFR